MIRGERMDQHHHGAELRRMERKDLQAVLDLINTEGWDYHISEMDRILDVDPENSVVTCSGGSIVGAITIAVSGKRAVLAHVVVKGGWRNKGIGQMMMGHLAQKMDSIGVETMEAYAVPAAVPFYKRHGYHNVEEIDTYDKILTAKDVAGVPMGEKIRPLGKEDLDAICRLDRTVTGFDRKNILRQLAGDFPGMAKGLFDGGEMTGYFLSRVNPIMNDLGPWAMAEPDFDDGSMMLRSTLREMKPGTRVLGGVAMNNAVVREIFLSLGFKAVHKAFRMVRSKGGTEPFRPGMMTLSAFEFG